MASPFSPYGQHPHMGWFADDTACESYLQSDAQDWLDSFGNPYNGCYYWNTTANGYRSYSFGWVPGMPGGGAAGVGLQGAYDTGNTVLLADTVDFLITVPTAPGTADFLVSGAGTYFRVRDTSGVGAIDTIEGLADQIDFAGDSLIDIHSVGSAANTGTLHLYSGDSTAATAGDIRLTPGTGAVADGSTVLQNSGGSWDLLVAGNDTLSARSNQGTLFVLPNTNVAGVAGSVRVDATDSLQVWDTGLVSWVGAGGDLQGAYDAGNTINLLAATPFELIPDITTAGTAFTINGAGTSEFSFDNDILGNITDWRAVVDDLMTLTAGDAIAVSSGGNIGITTTGVTGFGSVSTLTGVMVGGALPGTSGSISCTTGGTTTNYSGSLTFRSGNSASPAHPSGGVDIYTGMHTGGGAGNSGAIDIYTGRLFGGVNTGSSGAIEIHSGIGDDGGTGSLSFYTGNTPSAIDTGAISLYTGDQTGAGNSGTFDISTGVASNGSSGNFTVVTGDATANKTGNILLETGESFGDDGGNITLRAGYGSAVAGDLLLLTADVPIAGSGNSGSILMQSGYTPVTGGVSGGNISIITGDHDSGASGNLLINSGTNSTATNTNDTGDLTLYTGANNSTAGGDTGIVAIYSGTHTGSGTTGTTSFRSGNNTGSGSSGAVNVYSGTTLGAGVSGHLYAYSGDITAGASATGQARLYSGSSTGTAAGASGWVSVYSGSVLTSTSGQVRMNSGNADTGSSGDVRIYSGACDLGAPSIGVSGSLELITGGTNSTGVSGDITLDTGGSQNAISGAIQLTTGATWGTGATGAVAIRSGAPTFAGTGPSGNIDLYSGDIVNAANNSDSGDLSIYTGTSNSTGGGGTGNVAIYSGNQTASGVSGNVSLTSGSSPTLATGSLTLGTGQTSGVTFRSGSVSISSGNHTAVGVCNADTGSITVRSGDHVGATGGAGSGNLVLETGDCAQGGVGTAFLQSGTSTAAYSGAVIVRSAHNPTGSGTVDIYSGDATTQLSGDMSFLSGNSTANSSGILTIGSGTGGSATASTGAITMSSGDLTNVGLSTVRTGLVRIKTGDNAGVGPAAQSGHLILESGDSGWISGSVYLQSGLSSSTESGWVYVRSAHNPTGSGRAHLYTGDATAGSSGILDIHTGDGNTQSGPLTIETGSGTTLRSGSIEINVGTAPIGGEGSIKLRGSSRTIATARYRDGFSVGTHGSGYGYASYLGEGVPINQLWAYTNDGAAAWVDVSTAAESVAGSTFTFPGTGANNAIYISPQNPNPKFSGVWANLTAAAVLGGGEIVCEYWNGAWTDVKTMSTVSGVPYPHSELFLRTGTEDIRLNLAMESDWLQNDPPTTGLLRYWLRFRIATGITTAPIFEQLLPHAPCTKINDDGWPEYFGKARPYKKMFWDINIADAAAGPPGDEDIYVSDTLFIGRHNNAFDDGPLSENSGFNGYLPHDLDTSCPLIFQWSWMRDTAAAGNVTWVIKWGWLSDGDSVYISQATAPLTGPNEQSVTTTIAAPAQRVQLTSSVELDVSGMVSRSPSSLIGDNLFITITRNGGAGTDTLTGDAIILTEMGFYRRWCDGAY